ncbi:MAG: succinylglutamate desuccinylase/aspartoacylase family protein [Spirochaetia bacterium]|nr:succinylglutamate desuccinylase/aspartoacylase family protein [Spirochaetia bacterium]
MSLSIFAARSKSKNRIIKSAIELQENYFGTGINIPYVLIKGAQKGCKGVILSAIHGDELNGIQIIHKLTEVIDPENFAGELLMLPIANVPGFNLHSRYLPDRRDLNRLFPGQENGSEGSRLAWCIWQYFIQDADFGIDLHSASYNRWNYPHVRGNMRKEKVRKMAAAFGTNIVIHSKGVKGSLRREAAMRGIPFILFEAGQTNRFESDIVEISVNGILGVLNQMKMIPDSEKFEKIPQPSTTFYGKSEWIRADNGGLFVPRRFPGDPVQPDDILGDIHSIHGDITGNIKSKTEGRIIGFNLHPQVVPGRALYNIAYDSESINEPFKRVEDKKDKN